MKQTIFIKDRFYKEWTWEETMDPSLQHIHPWTHHLFHGDTIDISFTEQSTTTRINVGEQNRRDVGRLVPDTSRRFTEEQSSGVKITIVNSPTRQSKHIAGVLLLAGNNTYGRTPNKKRLYYRVIPQQTSLPYFLVPYDIQLSFHKVCKNKYVLFQFDSWHEQYPIGQLTETLGDVDNLEAFYDFQLYSKSLNASLQEMTKCTIEKTKQKTIQEYYQEILTSPSYTILDNTHLTNIITIDPKNSIDRDDALSIQQVSEDSYLVSVYLTNVCIWLEVLTLWRSFSSRVSTIYLPDKRRPMLPNIFSDQLCSLHQGQTRFVMQIDFLIVHHHIESVEIKSSMIKVANNYIYDEDILLQDTTYQQLHRITNQMIKLSKPHFDDTEMIKSNEIVSFWMIQTNTYCATKMKQMQIGIYRMIKPTIDTTREIEIPKEAIKEQIVQNWMSCSGQYTLYHETTTTGHLFLKTDAYIQITSPIRRLVDLLNQIMLFQAYHYFSFSEGAITFLHEWSSKLAYINTSMRSIRKIQVDCALLHKLYHQPEILQKVHEGIVFDRFLRNHGIYSYMVYLIELKLLSRLNTVVYIENNSRHQFHVYLFENEDSTKKKVRVEINLDS